MKKFVNKILNKFGLEIKKIRFEHDNMDAILDKQRNVQKNIIETDDSEWLKFKKDSDNVKISDENYIKNPFIFSNNISFELSNLCNYAQIHAKCPLNTAKEPEILQSKVIYNTLDCLKKYNFRGVIAFHNYNEPLIDPRLFKFVEYARKNFPENNIYICTNGYYFTQTLADELVEAGVSDIHVSVYSKKEFERISKISLKIPLKLTPMVLMDHVLHLYEGKQINEKKSCGAPLNEIIVTSSATVGLCCVDWKKKYIFGDLTKESIDQIMRKNEVYFLYQKLKKGERFLSLCKACRESR